VVEKPHTLGSVSQESETRVIYEKQDLTDYVTVGGVRCVGGTKDFSVLYIRHTTPSCAV